jgi:hypothetical protein
MVAGFWTLDRTTITGRSAVILRQHTTPFRPMIVPFDDLELIYQSLRTLEPPHTHKFSRVNAQDCKLGPSLQIRRPAREFFKLSKSDRKLSPEIVVQQTNTFHLLLIRMVILDCVQHF